MSRYGHVSTRLAVGIQSKKSPSIAQGHRGEAGPGVQGTTTCGRGLCLRPRVVAPLPPVVRGVALARPSPPRGLPCPWRLSWGSGRQSRLARIPPSGPSGLEGLIRPAGAPWPACGPGSPLTDNTHSAVKGGGHGRGFLGAPLGSGLLLSTPGGPPPPLSPLRAPRSGSRPPPVRFDCPWVSSVV